MASLDLRKVQNVVNQLKKAATGTPEDPEVLSLIRRQLGIPEQIGHADDGVHRSADLMADSGQKLAFGLVGHFSRLLGKEQRLLGDCMFDRFTAACGTFPTQRGLSLGECSGKSFSGGLGAG